MNNETLPSLVEQIQVLIAGAFQVPSDLVTPELAFGDLPQWDSLGHMEVMLRLEEQYGVEIDTDTIAELINVQEICRHLQERGYAK
jgi:acyl carrier protein